MPMLEINWGWEDVYTLCVYLLTAAHRGRGAHSMTACSERRGQGEAQSTPLTPAAFIKC